MIVISIIVFLIVAPFVILLPYFAVLGIAELSMRGAGRLAESTASALPARIATAALATPKFAVMMFKNIRRNLLRSSLVYLAVFGTVFVIASIWSILGFLENVTASKATNFKALITDKYQAPSRLPPSYVASLNREVMNLPTAMRPDLEKDTMTWSFVGTSTDPDPAKRTLDNIMFFFAMDPRGLLYMMDELEQDQLGPEDAKQMRDNVTAMQNNLKGIVVGQEKLRSIQKRVGDKLTVYCFPAQYKDIEFEVEIVGTFPKSTGRYDGNAILNIEYLQKSLDNYERVNRKPHPMADRYINLLWVRVPNEQAMLTLADLLDQPGKFSTPPVKVERGSAAISSFLDAYKDILAGMRYLLVPAIVVIMVLVIAIAISISVRERRQEMAVLKVLGFQPWQILVLVVGESLLIGILGGGICTAITYFGVNAAGGIPFPIGFFPKFFIPIGALLWGPMLGAFAAVAGSFLPAWSARSVRVSEVFAKIA